MLILKKIWKVFGVKKPRKPILKVAYILISAEIMGKSKKNSIQCSKCNNILYTWWV